jgi:hypothetical protein
MRLAILLAVVISACGTTATPSTPTPAGPQTAIGGGFFVGPTYWYNNKPCASADKVTLTAGQVLSLDLTFN